jgi:membrane protein YqaA with SNARE-associated domain
MMQLLSNIAIGDLPWEGYVTVFLISSLKYVAGVFAAIIQGYNLAEIALTAYLGSMIGVVILTYSGKELTEWLSKRFKRKKPMKYSRRKWIVKVWRKYGVWGIAFLSVLISPPAAVAIALSFRTSPRKIIISLGIMLGAWSIFFSIFKGMAKQLYDLF